MIKQSLKLKDIRIDGGTQPRAAICDPTVSDYVEAIGEGVKFPPVTVFNDGKDLWLADGFHRYHATARAGKTVIGAEIHSGTVRDAILFSVGANALHGLRRSNADKRLAVETLLNDEEWKAKSDNWIAQKCGVSQPFVSSIRGELTYNGYKSPEVREDISGRKINTENIGRKPEPTATESPETDGPTDEELAAIHTETRGNIGPDDADDCDPFADICTPDPAEVDAAFEGAFPDPPPTAETRAEAAAIVHDTLTDAPNEDELTDDEWLQTIPLWRVLATATEKRLLLRKDLLSCRTLIQSKAISTFAHHAKRTATYKTTMPGPLMNVMTPVVTLPDPKDWMVCMKCRGRTCSDCYQMGYALRHGIDARRVERGEIVL